MPFFKNEEVEKKYRNTNGDADPIIRVSIQYMGKLSNMPLNIADKVFADGGHIELTTDHGQPTTEKKNEKPTK